MVQRMMLNLLIIIKKGVEMIEIEHPGIMLKEDFLDDLDIKPGSFAKAIGVDRAAIKKIVDGKRAITADMALRFGLFFNMSAGFWLNLQKDYELRIVKRDRLDELEKTIVPMSNICLLYTSPSPRDQRGSRMPSSA